MFKKIPFQETPNIGLTSVPTQAIDIPSPEEGSGIYPFWQPPLIRALPNLPDALRKESFLDPTIKMYEDLFVRSRFEEDPDWSFEDTLKGDLEAISQPGWGKALSQAKSQEEYNFIRERLQTDIDRRERLEDAGVTGMESEMVASLLNPSTLIPLSRIPSTFLGAAAIGGLTASAVTVDEIFLRWAQPQRTTIESATNIITGGLFGGAFGGLGAYLTRRQMLDLLAPGGGKTPVTFSAGVNLDPLEEVIDNRLVQRAQQQYFANPSPFTRANLINRFFEAAVPPKYDIEIKSDVVRVREGDELRLEYNTRGVQRLSRADVEALARVFRGEAEGSVLINANKTDGVDAAEGVARAVKSGAAGDLSAASRATLYQNDPGEVIKVPLLKYLSRISPAYRNLADPFLSTSRGIQTSLETVGLRVKGARQGGTINDRTEYLTNSMIAKFKFDYNQTYQQFHREQAKALGKNYRVSQAQHLGQYFNVASSPIMTKQEFDRKVFEAIDNGVKSENPHINKAVEQTRTFFREIYKRAVDVDKEAKARGKTGLFPKGFKYPDDPTYIMHVVDPNVAGFRQGDIVEVLTQWIESVLRTRYDAEIERALQRKREILETADIYELPPEEAKKLRAELLAENKAYREHPDYEDARAVQEQIDDNRKIAKDVLGGDREEAVEKIKQLQQDEEFVKFQLDRRSTRRRLAAVNRSAGRMEMKSAEKFDRWERTEELQIEQLARIISKMRKLLNEADFTQERYRQQAMRLDKTFKEGLEKVERLEKRKEQLFQRFENDVIDFNKALEQEEKLNKRWDALFDKLNQTATRMDELEEIDPEEIEAVLREQIDNLQAEYLLKTQQRQRRSEKLFESGLQFAQFAQDRRTEAARLRQEAEELPMKASEAFAERYRIDGDSNPGIIVRQVNDPETGLPNPKPEADFSRYARRQAEQLRDHYLGFTYRSPNYDYISEMGPRGPEKWRFVTAPLDFTARVERVDPETGETRIDTIRWGDFLVTDLEYLTHAYARTMVPDIELTRNFGSAKPAEIMAPINREISDIKKQLADGTASEELQKRFKTEESFSSYAADRLSDLEVQLQRLRRMRGLPRNPNGFINRAGNSMLTSNVALYMGTLVISSLPEIALLMRWGFIRGFGNILKTFVMGVKSTEFEAGRREYMNSLGGEVLLERRMFEMYDGFDEALYKKSRIERGIDAAGLMMGRIALYNRLTDAFRTTATMNYLGKVMRDIEYVATNGEMQKDELRFLGLLLKRDDPRQRLEYEGISPMMAQRIYNQTLQPGGGNMVKQKLWMPNTENWTDQEAIDTLRQAIARNVTATVINPGIGDKMNMADANMLGRLMFQFQTFNMSATNKILMASAQQVTDEGAYAMLTLMPVLASMFGLGMLSYAFWALSSGEQQWEEAKNAPLEKWVDEAINRSGVLGILASVQRAVQPLPGIGGLTTFSEAPLTRTGRGSEPLEALLGPWWSTLGNIKDAALIPAHLLNPETEVLAGDISDVRRVMFFNNVFYLNRLLFDFAETSVVEGFDIPERSR